MLTLPNSYAIINKLDRNARPIQGIKCFSCQRTSWHPEDVKNKYCASCNFFHGDEVPFGLRAPFIYKKPGLMARLWSYLTRSK